MLQLQVLLLIFCFYYTTALALEPTFLSPFFNLSTSLTENSENFKIQADAFLSTPQLIKKYGYKVESHTVETEDGYLLELHRIPKNGKQPVLLVHGLLDSSATWVLTGPKKALAYILADHGYDVWLANIRGNRYSKRHRCLTASQSKFWDFTVHEIGKYDLPAIIDYVLMKCKKHKTLHYIGHSQGSTAFWILNSERPEYNTKVASMQALAPVAYLSNPKSPLVQLLKPFVGSAEKIRELIGSNEILPNSKLWALFGQKFCKDGEPIQLICMNFMFMLAGYNVKQTNSTMLPTIMGHIPAGASSKQFIHLMQFVDTNNFQQYDYGWKLNLLKYHRLTPSSYNISKTTTKVALYYSQNDWLVQIRDVTKLCDQLPNVIGKFVIDDKEFNHLDFVWGIDAKKLVYEQVVEILKKVQKDNGDDDDEHGVDK